MEDHQNDDQSHYEISLTAGQAFLAFVLLLLSLGAAFAFGLMIGKGQADERLVVRKATPVITEASLTPRKGEGRIVELGVPEEELQEPEPAATETAAPEIVEEGTAPAPDPAALLSGTPAETSATPAATAAASTPAAAPAATPPATLHATHYAQLLSTSDQKVAEALAARLINADFRTAYVERGTTERGPVFRVRVRFDSEAEARRAEPRLKRFSNEVWITSK